MNSISSLSIGSAGQSGSTSLHLMPPAIASWLHGNLLSGAPDNQDVLHAGYTIANQGEVNLLLEGYNRILAPAAISGDDNLGLGVYQAVF